MHDTASAIGAQFFGRYSRPGQLIVEIGACDVNGSIRSFADPQARYIGIDILPGPGVDLVVGADVPLPIQNKSADIVVATSVLEHDTLFWATFLDLLRITKDGGIVYINAPSNGWYHRYPNDNWRFFPDAGKALEKWGRLNGYAVHLVESFMGERAADVWNDFVAIFQIEPVASSHDFLSDSVPCTNVRRLDVEEPLRVRPMSEDMSLLENATNEIRALKARNATLAYELLRAKTYAAAFADVVDPHYRPAFKFSMQIDDRSAVSDFLDLTAAEHAKPS